MSELNSTQKRKARELCRERDGDKCTYPGCMITGEHYRSKHHRDFDLHHRDRNRSNNPKDASNWSLMCHSCNCKHDPRGRTRTPKFGSFKMLKNRAVSVSESERVWEGEKEWRWNQAKEKPAAMKKNEQFEPVFRKQAMEIIAHKNGIIKRKDLIDACSEASGCSQATGSRYLDKMASLVGMLSYAGKNESGSLFPIGERSDYEGELYVVLKESLS